MLSIPTKESIEKQASKLRGKKVPEEQRIKSAAGTKESWRLRKLAKDDMDCV
jgi:hypothetical protein